MSARDSVDLICSIAELASCFTRSHNLDEFLQEVVDIVGEHMHTSVCSIYLYDEVDEELILKATRGLNTSGVNHVCMKLGEGLTGLALKELRPICEANASKHPYYKRFNSLNEEEYEAYLGVPILRGMRRVGVLVVQHEQASYFGKRDIKALSAIASQLAGIIENARELMELEQKNPASRKAKSGTQTFYRFKQASPGIAFGTAVTFERNHNLTFSEDGLCNTGKTIEDFEEAVKKTISQLEVLQNRMEEQHSDVSAAMIFSAHLLMLKDPSFIGAMRGGISSGQEPVRAVSKVVSQYVSLFSKSQNEMLREKVQDIQDLGHRLIENILGTSNDDGNYKGEIIIAHDLLPSDMMKMSAQEVAGLILFGGSSTAHVTILARSLEIPMVIADKQVFKEINDGTPILIDGGEGTIFIKPDDDIISQFEQAMLAREQNTEHITMLYPETNTADGERINLMTNINLLHELDLAEQLHVDGIGLYRSEFPYIVRSNFPTEEELYKVYKRMLERMQDKPVIFRTLDIGGDKSLPYFNLPHEDNPFLGLRATRFSLRYPDIFVDQVKALLRAGAGKELNIMLPFITSLDEYYTLRGIIRSCCTELETEGVEFNCNPSIGIMIELPSAVEMIEELAEEADFLSIGSNDLIQYYLAVDRTNSLITEYYQPFQPAILRAFAKIANAAKKYNKRLSFCGEVAANHRMMKFLVGLDIKHLSMDPHKLPAIQKHISETTYTYCKEYAAKLLSFKTYTEVQAFLEDEV